MVCSSLPSFPADMYFHTTQAGEGDCHGRAREASRDQRGGKAPEEPRITKVLKAVGS